MYCVFSSYPQQCPAQVVIKWKKLNEGDERFKKGYFERVLCVDKFISQHDHSFYGQRAVLKAKRKKGTSVKSPAPSNKNLFVEVSDNSIVQGVEES